MSIFSKLKGKGILMEQINKSGWPSADEIEHLVMEDKDFIVFIDKNLDVDWMTSDKYDENEPTKREDHNNILNLAAKLECIPSDHHPKNIRINFKRMLGEAIARSLNYDEGNATKILKDAEEYIKERNNEKSRYWFLSASGFVTFIIIFISLIFWIQRYYLQSLIGVNAFFLLLSCFAGGLGALLSVIMRLGKTNMNPAAGKKLHYLEGSYRILAGCISALIIALAVKLGLILPIFSKIDNSEVAMILAGLIAGASERWAPSLIGKIETDPIKFNSINNQNITN